MYFLYVREKIISYKLQVLRFIIFQTEVVSGMVMTLRACKAKNNKS